jgi:hypothetical protein
MGSKDHRQDTTGRRVRAEHDGTDVGLLRTRDRFGGLDVGAALGGLLAGVGMAVIFGGLASGIGTVGYQLDVERDSATLSTGGFIGGLVVLLLSFLVAGWVAGRIGRYSGGVNGLLSAVLFIVLAAILAGLGAWAGDRYNVFDNIALPQWFHENATTAVAVLSSIIAVVVVLGAGFLGGLIGERYHRRADRFLAETSDGRAVDLRDQPMVAGERAEEIAEERAEARVAEQREADERLEQRANEIANERIAERERERVHHTSGRNS